MTTDFDPTEFARDLTAAIEARRGRVAPTGVITETNTFAQATSTIADGLLDLYYSQRRAAVAAEKAANPRIAPTIPGAYEMHGRAYLVRKARESGRLYASILSLSTKKFEYSGGSIYALDARDMMTPERAAELGALVGTCMVCGRILTDEKSVAGGIGPVCKKRQQTALAANAALGA